MGKAMRFWAFIAVLWISQILPAHGVSVEFPVTADRLDLGEFVFAVTTSTVPDEVSFHIVATAKKGSISEDSRAELSIVAHTEDANGRSGSIEPIELAIPFSLKKEASVWTTDFTVSREILKKPGLCYVLTVFAHSVIKGKRVGAGAADFYEIKLNDFAKP